MPENNWPCSIVQKISSYPDPKPGFSREVHAPIRQSRFGSFSSLKKVEGSASLRESSAEKMGNFLGIQSPYGKFKECAIKSFKFFWKEKQYSIVGKDKEKAVIEIDDGDEENRVDVSDDSRIEEPREKFVSDISNANVKLDSVEKMMEVISLDNEPDALGVPAHEKLHDFTKRRDDKLNSLDLEIGYNEKCLERFQLLQFQKRGEQIKKDVVEECFVPLTAEEEALVARALSNSNRRKILASHENSNIDITGEKLQCLCPEAWLNDEVINLYLELLKEREKREPQKFLKCHFFNTFFYKKLINGRGGYDFQSVRRWTTQRKLGYCLLDCEKIFVPIHAKMHWCLAIINKKDKKVQYLDSLKGIDMQVMNVLARYYVDEVKDKSGIDIDVSLWEEEFVTNLPAQENGFDCGMFMIKYVDFYSRGIGLCFNQRDMPYFRRRTAKEILKLRAE